ncbi:MAG TPA: outer membrane protein assembly factor BamA [Terriglobales bacterium]|nr:outer membrane protein assembly factor BamA [Terriglobales bacterium]
MRRFPVLLVLVFAAIFLAPVVALAQQDLIADVVPHGNRRIPVETIRARIFTKPGDVYDQAALERDFNSLWNTGYFDDIRFEREQTAKGWVIHIYVKEKPTIREIKYLGLNSVSQSDVLDRFKERKVSLTQESQYDPTRVKRAEVVIKELLAEHGRQFSTIRTEVRPIPPAAVGITFVVKEGPKVKVGKITFENNHHIKSRTLRYAMRNMRPIGIPHSIVLENIFSKTYNASKLSEDTEMVRDAYQRQGYFKAVVQDPKTQIRDTGGSGLHIPIIMHGPGKVIDIKMPVEEGDRYRLKEVKFTGNKAMTNTAALRKLIPMKDGEIFNIEMVRKGLKNLREAYGAFGYINFTPVPDTQFDDEKKLISLTIDLDEGKQFYVRRIEFKGNTTTRDKVIRRELAIEEGQLYNSKYWELSILRLNQLGYFDALKPEQDSDVKQNNQEGTVDITLKVKEKGKNSIGLSGGVSGLAGSFIGLTYETNNFLGLGETLTVQASIGSRQRNLSFGFTEPYLFDRPLQFGFTVFSQRFNFNQAQQASIVAGQKLTLPDNVLQSLQNFSQSRTGFSTSLSYPIRRSFKRVSLGYSFDVSSISVFSTFSQLYFQELNFRNISGPNSLSGIVTSKLIPSFTMNTVDSPVHPHRGRNIFIGGDIAGIGGNVSFVRPVVSYTRWTPMKGLKPNSDGRNSFGIRLQGSFISGYGGRVAPPFERFFMGGDTDIRGFDIRAISPVAFFVESVTFPLSNPDGTPVPKDPNNPRQGAVTVPLPVQRIIFPGGDTSVVSNMEYRIPIIGPVTLAPFFDLGFDGIARPSALQVNSTQLTTLNTTAFGCPALDIAFNCVGGVSQSFSKGLKIVGASNWRPRTSTGLELQVIMPVVNAPFRIYWAYNPLRLNTSTDTPNLITRSMFPVGGAGDFSYQQAISTFAPGWNLKEPKTTFRFTVATTF